MFMIVLIGVSYECAQNSSRFLAINNALSIRAGIVIKKKKKNPRKF